MNHVMALLLGGGAIISVRYMPTIYSEAPAQAPLIQDPDKGVAGNHLNGMVHCFCQGISALLIFCLDNKLLFTRNY